MRPASRSGNSSASTNQCSRAAAARAAAARAVATVVRGRSLDSVLAQEFSALDPALAGERALIQEMTYGALRWYFQIVPLVRGFLKKSLKDDELEALLIIGFYQLLHMRVAAHAAVKETVAATVLLNKVWAKGMTNALLRRVLREETEIRQRIAADEALAFAHPAWLLTRLQADYPDAWRGIAQANNARPPLTLRVHRGRISSAMYREHLAQAGIASRTVPDMDSALILDSPVAVEKLPGFQAGEVSVQDAGAQFAAELLDARPGEHVLDACAAPGGKAAHILERTPMVALVALDVEAARLDRVRENFTRLGLAGAILPGDATRPTDWWDGRPFDRILLDAPCSATGVIRRHPDIRLHRRAADIAPLAATQARLLDALWPLLAPGGKLLYVTCSILPQENAQPLAAFLARHPDASPDKLAHPALERGARFDGTGYQILPGSDDMDGFYYSRLAKKPAVAPGNA